MTKRDRILFVGLSCLDSVYVCNDYPEEDSDNRAKYNVWRRGGNASNNCTVFMQLLEGMSSQDLKVEYLGTIADDLGSKFLIKDFKENGIITENVVFYSSSDTLCPSSAVIINGQNGSRTIIHCNKNLPELTFESFSKLCLDKYKIIHFEGRNVTEMIKMIEYIRQKDIKREIIISVELERARNQLLDLFNKDIDFYFVEKEFAYLMNCNNSEQTVREIAKKLHSKALVICPWAETGAKAIDNQNKQIVSSPAFTPKTGVVDTLGAGDTFLSATLFALTILNYPLQEAIELGCQVAGAKCGLFGYKHLNQFKQYI